MDDALLKPCKVKCSVKVGSPWVWDEEWQDYVEKPGDVSAVGTLVEVKDPKALRAREFRADMVHGPDATNEDVIMCDLAPSLEAVLNGTDSVLFIAGVSDGAQAELMDGAEGLAAAAVWQLAQELHDRQANHRANGAVGYTYHMRLQSFHLSGDSLADLLTDTPEAARLVDMPVGVVAEGVRTASATSADEFMKYVEGAQRRRDPSTRQHGSTVFILDVTQADYYEGWGLHGRFLLIESVVMDCLSEDKGLVQVREGYDRYRGVYHMRSLAKSWKPGEACEVHGSSLTWLLREVFTGGSIEAHFLFCLAQGKAAVSIALMELMEDLGKIQTNPVTQDHRVAGWARAMRCERIALKATEKGGGSVDRDTRSLILELEKRLAAAERTKEEAQRIADARQERAHAFQDKYVVALENQESMNEKLIGTEEEQLKAMQQLIESQMETSEIKDEYSEMQYTDNVLLMMLEQEVAELKESADKKLDDLGTKQAKRLEDAQNSAQDLRARLDALTEAKIQTEIQKEVQKGDLENKLHALRLELREGRLADSVQHVQEKGKYEESMNEELERLRQALEDERSRARQVKDDVHMTVRQQMQREREQMDVVLQEERQQLGLSKEEQQSEVRVALEQAKRQAEESAQAVQQLQREERELREVLADKQLAERQAQQQQSATAEDLQRARRDFHQQLLELAESPAAGPDSPARQSAVASLRGQLAAAGERELAFQGQLDETKDKVAELQRKLRRVCRTALDWAPETATDEERARVEMALESAGEVEISQRPLVIGLSRAQELQKELASLQDQLVHERQEATAARGQHSGDLARLQQEKKKLEEGLRTAEAAAQQAEESMAAQAAQAKDAPPALGLTQIQDRLLAEVQSLRSANQFSAGAAVNADLQEQNRSLQARLSFLEKNSPADRRAQAQRNAFLEKSIRSLEAERFDTFNQRRHTHWALESRRPCRSELLVRTTVAEEQLKQLQKHLKEMTEDYQMQILNLKMKGKTG
ncbi:unnamed protein product [Effrenium voratum]|uniref:Kinesin motor domain-containing protein n=1 Tax=Effrenium voratum TaxID=2562239 RepID=A0AA36MNS0_9DINO|nr:unnamed protein product [Effrenium voratum]CAJ1461931.1 unnamed protein product [Effrenium voratum]